MVDQAFLGVRVKVWQNGGVAVILFKIVDDKILKFYLDDDGDWQKVSEGAVYPGIGRVFHEIPDSNS